MDERENKSVVRQAFDAWNRGDVETFVGHYTEDLRYIPTSYGARPVTVGREMHRQAVESWFAAFPDIRMEYQDLIAEDDRVFVRFVCSGTHEGHWQGIAPTGRKVVFEEWHLLRLENGLIVEEASLMDELTLLSRIGAVTRG